MKMTLAEALNNQMLIEQISLQLGFPTQTATKLTALKMSYRKIEKAYQEDIQEALKCIKPEGFDERFRKAMRFRDIENRAKLLEEWNGEGEKPNAPTEEELKEAEEIRPMMDDFLKEEYDMNVQMNDIIANMRKGEIEVPDTTLTWAEWGHIYDAIGIEGDMSDIKNSRTGTPIKKELFLEMLAESFIKE